MKIFKALASAAKKRDTVSQDRLELNRVRATIEELCERYLQDSNDIFEFEALPSAIDNTLAILETPYFLERYEFQQISETCFIIRLKELDIL
jgi:hypothetical protein